MITLFWLVFWAGLSALVVAAGVSLHTRRKDAIASDVPRVDDTVVDQIIDIGAVQIEEEEPLDLTDIDDEEERFWSESWDEPNEW